jgi:glycosyltransferase involved in cell wall biosynthesis
MNSTLHVLANPHGITDLRYRMEPFNIAVSKFISNMNKLGYELLHYGHELSCVECENIPVIFQTEVPAQSNDTLFDHKPGMAELFGQRANKELLRRYKTGDIILCFYGSDHYTAVQNIPTAVIVEPSIGYRAEAVFAPYRVFTSYAQMHYYYGYNNMLHTPSWSDAVIPNSFTVSEFKYCDAKADYLLYLGRISGEKGIDMVVGLAKAAGKQLIIAGPGTLQSIGYDQIPDHVTMYGYADAEQRRELLSNAAALVAPTYYIEPFGNIVIEAAMSGTPVITSDWGGFTETVVPGRTGYRCRSFEEFVQAVSNLSKINTWACRDWAVENYSDQVVHKKFDQYFKRLQNYYEN